MSEHQKSKVQVRLLGGFELWVDGQLTRLTSTAERLIAFLGSSREPLPRRVIAAKLWPDVTEARSCANLRSALYRLRELPALSSHHGLFRSSRHLGLAPGTTVDLHQARDVANRLINGMPRSEDLAETSRHSLERDLLPESYDEEWVFEARETFRQMRLHALEAMCVDLAMGSRHGEAVAAGLAAVHGEPLRESAQRALITAHLLGANYGEAVRQFERFCAVLQKELGVAPSPQLRDLIYQGQVGDAMATAGRRLG